MSRHSLIATLTILILPVSSNAAVILTSDGGVDTPGLPGFRTHTVTATSTVAGELIERVDFIGNPDDPNPATARGFFGTMNQLNPNGLPTVFTDNNAQFASVGALPEQDSQFLFDSQSEVLTVPGNFAEGPTFLRALFQLAVPPAQSLDLAQLVIPAEGTVNYRGVFSVTRESGLVDLPEISGTIVIPEPATLCPFGLAIISIVSRIRRRG